jgi:hypothetical protein
MLNNRKRFVISAALAAVFAVLAGGANALATTVWTVSKASSNTTCSSITVPPVTTCNTIGSAVGAATNGDVIVVGPGKYNESLTITVPLSIFGAQAGKDARVDRHDSSKESIVDASETTNGTAFLVQANFVVIDGFTIQGGTAGDYASGIWLQERRFSPQVLNNIIQNNAVGVFLDFPWVALIEHNLIKTNNEGTAGTNDSFIGWSIVGTAGYGIAGTPSPGLGGATITENEFTGNRAAAMYLYEDSYSAITRNTSENDGSFVIFSRCNYTQFSHNQGRNFGADGVLPLPGSIYAGAAIEIDIFNQVLEINDNHLEGGKAPISNGIAFTNILGTSPSLHCKVNNNRINRFPGNGIVAEDGTGTVYDSWISGNQVEDNGQDGILVEGPVSLYNYGNFLFENEAKGNHVNDCEDDTTGAGPLGTNTWLSNTGNLSSPTGLCTSGRSH